MKKYCIIILLIIIISIFVQCAPISSSEPNEEFGGNRWIEEESGFLDYTIVDETIQFRYLFCFQNDTEYDLTFNAFAAKFKKRDLKGWLQYEKFFNGTLENGENSVTVKAGEKKNLALIFEGEYLGGTVNENLNAVHIGMVERVTRPNQ